MISIIKFKKYIINICIFNIIINKFRYRQELCLVILLKINKGIKINFYYNILSIDLFIYLRIKYNKKFLFNIKEII